MADANKSIRFVNTPQIMAVDGHTVTIHNDQANIIFFQIFDPRNEVVDANVVGSIRMTMQQLTNLREAIDQTVEKHEKSAKTEDAEIIDDATNDVDL